MDKEKLIRLSKTIKKSERIEASDINFDTGIMTARFKFEICNPIDSENKFSFSNINEFIESLDKSNAVSPDKINSISKKVIDMLRFKGINEDEKFGIEFFS